MTAPREPTAKLPSPRLWACAPAAETGVRTGLGCTAAFSAPTQPGLSSGRSGERGAAKRAPNLDQELPRAAKEAPDLVEGQRVLALDVGQRRIGVAVSDVTGTLAVTAGVIQRKGLSRDLEAIRGLVARHGARIVVVGLPLSLSGGLGPQAQTVLAFVEVLRAGVAVPVDTWDERYTSVEAERALRAQGLKPRRVRQRIDEVAAAGILQEYLDAQGGAVDGSDTT